MLYRPRVPWTRRSCTRELGCKPAPRWPAKAWDVLGLGYVRQLVRADREKRLPSFVIERMVFMSERENRAVTTAETNKLGTIVFMTSDPKNIQAILATQFQDFGLGNVRRNNFLPLLGSGIVSISFVIFRLLVRNKCRLEF